MSRQDDSGGTWAVIMAGGSGTRFWPLSRKTRPKQLLSLLTERSLLAETVARVAPAVVDPAQVLIVTGPALAEPTRALFEGSPVRTVVEPRARNTAPCIGLAAALVAHQRPSGVLAVLPADQTITDVAAFRRTFRAASALASTGRIVTVGIRPSHPETGYGYIRRGAALESPGLEVAAYAVQAFVEKPNRATAESYLASGDYDWNAGMFFVRADVMLAAIGRHLPGLAAGLAEYRPAIGTPGEESALVRCFELAEPISIDFGVMEKEAENTVIIPADIGWSDVGSWRTLLDFREGEDNFTRGDVSLTDVSGSVVLSTGPHVEVLGVTGLTVVATPDAVLVAPIDRSQDVGALVKRLNETGRQELT